MSLIKVKAVTGILILWCGAAMAMEPHVDCRNPFIFEDADVNLVVLPYRSAGDASSPIGEMGQRLALLVKLDVFSHILDYGSIGAVQMEVRPGANGDVRCQPEVVMSKLLGGRTNDGSSIATGLGVVFVWGIVYEEEKDVVVQTYARFVRRDVSEAITLKAGELAFQAKPTTATIVFSPQLFSKERIAAVEASYAKADFVRQEPRDDAAGEPLPHPVIKCFDCDASPNGFQVEERRGEWIHVHWSDPSSHKIRGGWIHASGGLAGHSLEQFLPELSFIEGTVGYLQHRIVESRGGEVPKRQAELTEQSFAAFQKTVDLAATRPAAAVALQLSGIVRVLAGDRASLSAARQDFDAATALAPYDANSITLGTVTAIVDEWNQRHAIGSAKAFADRLTAAAALADDRGAAIGNLRNLYTLLQAGPALDPAQGLTAATIAERLRKIDGMQVALK